MTVETTDAFFAPAKPAPLPPPIDFDILNSDAGNARRLIAAFGDSMRYNSDRDKWMVWKHTHWAIDSKGHQLSAWMKQVLQKMRDDAKATMDELGPLVARIRVPDDPNPEEQILIRSLEQAKLDYAHSIKSESDRAVTGAVHQAASEPGMSIQENAFDSHLRLFNVENGTFDLDKGELREHHREDLLTFKAPVTFDEFARCPRFMQFLHQIQEGVADEEQLLDYIQRICGYLLCGDTTERILPFWLGDGGNGKGVLANVLLGVMGKDRNTGYGWDMNFSSFVMAKNNEPDKPRNDVMRMIGKRFLTASENDNPGARLDTEILKKISGHDGLEGRSNYTEGFPFDPQAKVILRMNNPPRIIDTSNAIWERVKYVEFPHLFTEELGNSNHNLIEELLAAEAPGIFNWMLQGWYKVQTSWREKKPALVDPPSVKAAVQQFRESQSLTVRFFQERYQVLPKSKDYGVPVSCSVIYSDFSAWCVRQGEKQIKTQTAFGIDLERHLRGTKTEKKRANLNGSKQMCWLGIAPLHEEPSI